MAKKNARALPKRSNPTKEAVNSPYSIHKPTVSSPLGVTNMLKKKLASSSGPTNASSPVTLDAEMETDNASRQTAECFLVTQPSHIPTDTELTEFNIPDFAFTFQRTLREHEEQFNKFDESP
ncbi:hypothetical protein BDB01DRAFT_840261 [Pilobolus umbonatus]|nr:hypothetical protein BDB01DRAFT_840261 [Pilobolus umbonatus]